MVEARTVYRLNTRPRGSPRLCRQGIMNVRTVVSHWNVNSAAANTPVHECNEYRWPIKNMLSAGLSLSLREYITIMPSADTRYANVCNMMYGSVTVDLSCLTKKMAREKRTKKF